MLSLALERAALEAALAGEQGEVRLMRQEVEVQQDEVERLEAALEATRQQVEDMGLALREEAGVNISQDLGWKKDGDKVLIYNRMDFVQCSAS